MIGCLVLAFQLCNPNTPYGGYAYSGGYAASSAYVVQAQPVYVVQPQPVYVVQQPVYYAQPYPFGGGGISVNVGRRGGVGVRCC